MEGIFSMKALIPRKYYVVLVAVVGVVAMIVAVYHVDGYNAHYSSPFI